MQLDSKKSPLALLAQTCSQIGSDAPVGKSSEKKKPGENREKSSPISVGSADKSAAKSSDLVSGSSSSVTASAVTRNRHLSDQCASREISNSSTTASSTGHNHHSKTTTNNASGLGQRLTPSQDALGGRKSAGSKDNTRDSSSSMDNIPSNSGAAVALQMQSKMAHAGMMAAESLLKDNPLAAYKSLMSSIPNYHALPHGGTNLHHYPGAFAYSDLAALGNYASALNAVKSMPPPPPAMAFSLPGYASLPYNNHRLQKPPSADNLLLPMSMCRDPYCTGCPSNLMALGSNVAMICPAGCVQCDHPKVPFLPGHHNPATATAAVTGLVSSSSTTTSSSSINASVPATTASTNLNATSSNVSPTGQQLRPYVCNWIVGDNYCGKRFQNSEELLQHLRTHTNLSTSDTTSAAASLLPPSQSPFPTHHAHLAAAAAANGIQRSYPTPPLSPLSAARYHPYSKAVANSTAALSSSGLAFPTLLGLHSMQSANNTGSQPSFFHPALAPYYSHLQQFYAPRIGSASLPP